MSHPILIICEQTGRWAAVLHRANVGTIRETRILDDCWQELSAAPDSLVALELRPGNAEQVWAFLVDLERRFPYARAAILLAPELLSLEPGLRELGAVCVISSVLQLVELSSAVQQHTIRLSADSSDDLGAILAKLPWP